MTGPVRATYPVNRPSSGSPSDGGQPPAHRTPERSGPQRPWRNQAKSGGLLLTAILVGLFILVPILFGFLGGFKDNAQLSSNPLALPSPWNYQNYTDVLASGTFWRQVFNSTFIAVFTVLLVVGAGAAAAYIFARFSFRGREPMFMLFAAGLMFPPAVAILPIFVLMRELQLLNSPWGVILPQAAFGLPLTIIILRTFFRTIPAEIEESATLDGASVFGVFWRIMLPMARPAIAVVSVLALVTSWNNFLLPLVVFSDPTWWTLPVGVTQFQGQYSQDTARVLAYVMLAMLPALGFFFLAERQLVAGIAPTSGNKG